MRHNNVRGWLRDVRSLLGGGDPALLEELLDAYEAIDELVFPAGAGDGEDGMLDADGGEGVDEETHQLVDELEDVEPTLPGMVRVDGRADELLHGTVAAPGGAGGGRPVRLPTVLRRERY